MSTPEARKSIDFTLLIPVLFLVCLGVVMVYSASSAVALKRYGTDLFFLKRQVMFALMGAGMMLVVSQIPYKFWKILVYPGLAVSIGLLVLIYLIGHEAGSATRWFKIGPVSFQPVELVKLVFITYLAYSLSKKEEYVKNFAIGTLPHAIVTGVLCFLVIMQPDFGSTLTLGLIMVAMLFIAGVPIYHLLLLGVPALLVGIPLLLMEPYRVTRLISFMDPWQYESGSGYQIIHSLMAFGTGGVSGTGIGASFQKLFYLPEAHTDFIFAVLAEELGLIGSITVILVYVWIVFKGMMISRKAPDTFSSLLAAGISFSLGWQICFNMGVVMALLPTKGLALPFLSYGGSSLIFNMAACGLLLNISRYVDETAYERIKRTVRSRVPQKRYAN